MFQLILMFLAKENQSGKKHFRTLMVFTSNMLITFVIASLVQVSSAQTCKSYKFSGDIVYDYCIDLPTLQAHLYWNHDFSAKALQVAYRARQMPKGWVAWGINPNETGMIGTQALVAFQDDRGRMKVYTTQVDSYNPGMKPRPLNFLVSQLSAKYLNNEMIIFAVLGPLSNGTSFNIVWQAGNLVLDNIPQMHPVSSQNIRSYKWLNFLIA